MKGCYFALWSLVISSGCMGTEIGNPQDGEAVLRVMSGDMERTRAGGLRVASFDVEEVTMSFASVSFKGGPGGNHDAGVKGLVWLVRGGELQSFDLGLDVEAGVYRSVKMRVSPPSTVRAGSDHMEGVSIRMVGRRADGVKFVLEEDRAFKITARGDVGKLRIDEERSNMLFLMVDVDSWLTEGELIGLEPGADGVVRINRGENRKLLKDVRQRLKLSMSVGQDEDEDGRPSANEFDGFHVEVGE